MDRLATRKDALNRQETYQYDPAGNLTQFTDRKNQLTTYEYDALNRRTKATFADGSTVSHLYDAAGRLASVTDSLSGTIEFAYDILDRLLEERTPQGMVVYQYDPLGRRTAMSVNGQTPVAYVYDAASRLLAVSQGSQEVDLAYDAANRRTSLTYPNGTSTTYGYDSASRLINIAHNGPAGLIESLSYLYDAAGNRVRATRTNGAASDLPAAVQAAYDAANQQLQFNSATNNQTFDANGNQTSDGTNTYTWDARNRLIARSGPGINESYSYDALGRRISKTINGVTTQYLYDGNDIVQETSGAGTASYLRSLNIDEPFVRQTASGNESYHTDALGSTLALTNQAGAVQTGYSYEAFGKTAITGTSSNPFQYTGRENDGTGLYYYRARYYAPTPHRFVSEDPLGSPLNPLAHLFVSTGSIRSDTLFASRSCLRLNPQEANLFVYVINNPLIFRDPLGLDKTQCRDNCGFAFSACETKVSFGAGRCVLLCFTVARYTRSVPLTFICLTYCGFSAAIEYAVCIGNRDACLQGCQ